MMHWLNRHEYLAALLLCSLIGSAEYHGQSIACDGHPCGLLQDEVLKSPDKPRVHLNLGTELMKRNRKDEALEELTKASDLAMNLQEDDLQKKFNLGGRADIDAAALLIDEGYLSHAIDVLGRTRFPKTPEWYTNMGVLCLRLGMPDVAYRYLGQGLKSGLQGSPEGQADAPIYFNMGDALYSMGDCAGATALYRKANAADRTASFPARPCP